MTALLGTVLAASLVGSVHCAGMCGGLVAFYAATPGRGARAPWLAHVAYNAGRLGAYAALGAAAGAIGGLVDTTGGAFLGLQRVAAALAGVLILLWGLASLFIALGGRLPSVPAPRVLRRGVGRTIAALAAAQPVARAAAIGVLTGCLPCGWLYAFVVAAAGTGSALEGAVLMAVFWVGTVPMMLGLGLGIQAIARPLLRHVPAACAVALIVVGLLALDGRVRAVDLSRDASRPAPVHSGHFHGAH
jgi:hypothetical protein